MSQLVREVCVGGEEDGLTVASEHSAEDRVTQSHRVSYDRVEHRLDIDGRAADDLQDFCGGCLLLKRLAYLCVRRRQRFNLLLQYYEQPQVLDRDDGLVGERLQ